MSASSDTVTGVRAFSVDRSPQTYSAAQEEALSAAVRAEQVRLVFGQAALGVVVNALVGVILVWVVHDGVEFGVLAAWAGLFAAALAVRAGVAIAYARESRRIEEAPVWRRRWNAALLVAGCTWGLAGVLLPSVERPEISVFVAFVLGGIAAGALATQSAVFTGFLALVVPTVVPVSAWFYVCQPDFGLWMGTMVAIFGATLVAAARYYAHSTERSLRLGLENSGLVHELVDANEIAQDTNRQLEAEIQERTTTEERLRASEEHFRNLIDASIQGTMILRDGTILFANDTYARMLGWESGEKLVGRSVLDELVPTDDREALLAFVEGEPPLSDASNRHQGRAVRADGTVIVVEYAARQVNWYGQRAVQVAATDITERKQVEAALRLSEEKFKDFAESAADWFFETDAALRFTYVSERFGVITGWRSEEVIGLTQRDLLRDSMEDPEKLERHFKELDERRAYQTELLSTGKEGGLHVFHYAGKPIYDERGRFRGYRGAGRDVTQAYQLSKQLSYQATHDALTGLLNRRAFESRLERVLATAREDGSTHALCYLDLDQFKVINDTCGHIAGDELLRQLGRLLPAYIRKRDTLARLGGDEFGVLMEHCSLDQAERVAGALCRAIEDYQYVWEDRSFRIGCSIGLVPITDASESIAAALSSADTACYAAKDKGRRRVHVYRPGDEELARRYGEMQWAVRINRSLEEHRFRLVYQPIAPVNVPSGDSQLELLSNDPLPPGDGLHFELLLRLEETDGTLTPPGAFLPAAERYNLSSRIDRWVCDTAFDWLEEHPEILARTSLCAINLSGHSLGDAGFLAHLSERFERDSLPAGRFCFEITETAAITNFAAATAFIHTLGERGCRFALDDFGSGLSSFAYLKTLPVQFLKIDGVFVKDIADDPIDLAMVKSINEIGQVMGKKTVAEFVESEEVLAQLRVIGVNFAQGFAIARPRPIEELLGVVTRPLVRTATGD